jgi:hypothetical protein
VLHAGTPRTSRFGAPQSIALGQCGVRLWLTTLSQCLENDAGKEREDWRAPVRRHLGLRISDSEPNKPSNMRISGEIFSHLMAFSRLFTLHFGFLAQPVESFVPLKIVSPRRSSRMLGLPATRETPTVTLHSDYDSLSVNIHLIRARAAFRCRSQARISDWRRWRVPIRRSRHWPRSAPISISTMFSQLACLGT